MRLLRRAWGCTIQRTDGGGGGGIRRHVLRHLRVRCSAHTQAPAHPQCRQMGCFRCGFLQAHLLSALTRLANTLVRERKRRELLSGDDDSLSGNGFPLWFCCVPLHPLHPPPPPSFPCARKSISVASPVSLGLLDFS